MRIAFFTPLSPVQSALADFGEGLALALANLPGVTVDLFTSDDYQPDNDLIRRRFQVRPYREFAASAHEYDVPLYSMGDHGQYHGYMLALLHRYPGVIILNDLTFHRTIVWETLGRGNLRAYLDELAYGQHEVSDTSLAERIRAGFGHEILLDYPLFARMVTSSRGVIVQNEYARREILAKRPQANVTCIPYPFFMPPGLPDFDWQAERVKQRAALNLENSFVVGSFGIFVPNKHLYACLQAFARVLEEVPQAHYLLGGTAVSTYDLSGQIRRMGLADHVTITGWLPPPDFARQMLALDAGIHLRYPHIGGTPYTPIRMMGLGAATIVSDIEPLAELPEGTCAKIVPDDYEEEMLYAVLRHLALDEDFRRRLCQNGRQFIVRHHHIDEIARRYLEFMTAVG